MRYLLALVFPPLAIAVCNRPIGVNMFNVYLITRLDCAGHIYINMFSGTNVEIVWQQFIAFANLYELPIGYFRTDWHFTP